MRLNICLARSGTDRPTLANTSTKALAVPRRWPIQNGSFDPAGWIFGLDWSVSNDLYRLFVFYCKRREWQLYSILIVSNSKLQQWYTARFTVTCWQIFTVLPGFLKKTVRTGRSRIHAAQSPLWTMQLIFYIITQKLPINMGYDSSWWVYKTTRVLNLIFIYISTESR